jgi:hypothetical protein
VFELEAELLIDEHAVADVVGLLAELGGVFLKTTRKIKSARITM